MTEGMSLERLRDNAPQPFDVDELGITISIRDITDGERDEIAHAVEKERRQKIADRYREFRDAKITDDSFVRDEIDAINTWAMAEQTKRSAIRMVVEPDLSNEEAWKTIPRRKLDAIFMALIGKIESEAREYLENKQRLQEAKESIKKS